MASWIVVACLEQLFTEFNHIAPSRDRTSDGRIGDAAHQAEVSDHNPDEVGSVPIHDADKINEVHAIDVDSNLNESDLTMEKVVQFILARCRAGAERRLRYIIYNRRIWSASSGWVQKPYTGASAHTEHAHFSASYTTSLEASTVLWRLEDIPVALTSADKAMIKEIVTGVVESQLDDIANAVWSKGLTAPAGSDPMVWPAVNMLRNAYNEAKASHVAAQQAADNTNPPDPAV